MQQEFAYEGGRFVPAEVVPHASGHPDASGRLDAAGYRPGQAFGDTDGTHYVLWERAAGPEAGAPWVVAFCTAERSCVVGCRTWPDLIGLLAALGPIAAASVLDGGVRHLLEDAVRRGVGCRGAASERAEACGSDAADSPGPAGGWEWECPASGTNGTGHGRPEANGRGR